MKNNFSTKLLIGTNLLLICALIMGFSLNKATTNSEISNDLESSVSIEPFIGEISMFAGNFAPRGWALCEGQLLPISQYSALFSILGTTYGGDGRTTFALPDLRGRVPMHPGNGPGLSNYRLGQKGGAESATITILNLPAHNHPIQASTAAANANEATGNVMGNAIGMPGLYSSNAPDSQMKPTGNKGGSQPFDIRQPYQCVNYIIALQGVFPSRS